MRVSMGHAQRTAAIIDVDEGDPHQGGVGGPLVGVGPVLVELDLPALVGPLQEVDGEEGLVPRDR